MLYVQDTRMPKANSCVCLPTIWFLLVKDLSSWVLDLPRRKLLKMHRASGNEGQPLNGKRCQPMRPQKSSAIKAGIIGLA